jgi:uncharacterized circularly permuted ATP-grasp superfamily protein
MAQPFYTPGAAFDEMYDPASAVRDHYGVMHDRLTSLSAEDLNARQSTLERSFLLQGITFTVYGAEAATERIIPTDLIPRIIPSAEWDVIEAGLTQRLRALNMFLADIYGEQKILMDGIVPRDLVLGAPSYRREMQHLYVPHKAYANVCGSDLIRGQDGAFYVLEDNLRVPSGVSYMLANRDAARRTFPGAFRAASVRPVERYPDLLLATLKSMAQEWRPDPQVVVLTPGVYNSHRPAAGRRHLPPGRRRLHRPPGLPARFQPRRRRAVQRLSRRQRDDLQRPRHRGG